MNLAFASPLPPAASGIADYSAELLPALAATGARLTLYYEGGEQPAEPLRSLFRCRPIGELTAHAAEHEAIVYQLGNSAPHHAGIFRAALEIPGIVVLHEYMLHHLVSALTIGIGDGDSYVEELRYAAGETGRRAGQRLLDTHHPIDLWRFPLFERIVDRSRGVMVHSQFAARRIRASRAAAAVEVVPFPVDLAALPGATEEARRAARAELGVEAGALLVGTFGLVTPHKRLAPTLGAFAELRRRRPLAELWICGEVSPHFDLAGLLREKGGEGVRVTGRMPLDEFHAAMRACDVAVNLRHPTGGETSASLLRLLGTGVPTIATDTGSFAEIPDGAVVKLAIDDCEEALLVELLLRLADDPRLRAGIGREARRYVSERHEVGVAARVHRAAIERLAAAPEPGLSPAPLAASRAEDPRIGIVSALAGAAVDLGRDETDLELLASLSAAVTDLGWSPGRAERK